MPLNSVTFNRQQGGLGVLPPNDDHISALLFGFTKPASWTDADIKEFRSIEQVEAEGIEEQDPLYGQVHYHAREFFRVTGGAAILWIGFQITDANVFRNATGGKVRQIAQEGTTSNIGAFQTFLEALETIYAPAVGIYGLQEAGLTLAGLADLTSEQWPQVNVLISGDGAGDGAAIATALGLPYIPALGAVLGATAAAPVNESVAYVANYNLQSNEGELEEVKFCDGSNLEAVLEATLAQLDDKHYMFHLKQYGISGTYLNDTNTAIVNTNDYSKQELNRTIQKAIRLGRIALLPQLNGPLFVDPDTGQLSADTVKYFESLLDKTLRENMLNQGELSGFSVDVPADQNVLQTSKLEAIVKLVPVGVARQIEVKIGFTASV